MDIHSQVDDLLAELGFGEEEDKEQEATLPTLDDLIYDYDPREKLN
ncbi:MAG: hypothetical protein PVS3B3_24840 [Ktedonobacteraceae bacterium]